MFNEKPFLNTLLGFSAFWNYKPNNEISVDSHGVYTSEEILNLSAKNKIVLKCDVIDGSLVNGLRGPILYRPTSNIAPMWKLFNQLERVFYKKVNKPAANTILFYLEDDNHRKVKLNGGTLTFTSQLIKI